MIDWLRREMGDPVIELGGEEIPIAIRRNKRARRLTLRLAPDGSEVRLTLPKWCATAEAVAFAHARRDWLEEQRARIPQPDPPRPGGTIRYRGEALAIKWRRDEPRRPRRKGSALHLGGPEAGLEGRIRRWLEGEAVTLLTDDLAYYSEQAGIAPRQLRLSRAQKRWGSCSTGGTVRINWRLVQAPDMVRRSVVAHEIAHCLHFDHGPDFHAALEAIFEADLASADAWLRQNGRTLYTSFG